MKRRIRKNIRLFFWRQLEPRSRILQYITGLRLNNHSWEFILFMGLADLHLKLPERVYFRSQFVGRWLDRKVDAAYRRYW